MMSKQNPIRRTGVAAAKGVLRAHHRLLASTMGRPVKVGYWQTVRGALARVSNAPDALFPPRFNAVKKSRELPIAALRPILRADELGEMSIDGATIAHLWRFLVRERPRFIVECGAGVSTIVLAKFLSSLPDSGGRRLVSVEQSESYLTSLRDRLLALGLAHLVRLLHVPVSKNGEYEFPDATNIRAVLDDHWADWIVIDGPFGPPGCRQTTLPFLAQLARPGARWWLDDALRDGELTIVLRRWLNNSNWSVEGIWPLGKGLATGHITRTQ
jgi:hypothetical protein